MKKKSMLFLTLLTIIVTFCTGLNAEERWQPETGWAKGIKIRFFVGGAAGDKFASIVLRGAQQAEKDLGCKVEYVFSAWAVEKMTGQFREAVAAKPDGIAMMGHAGDAANMAIAKDAESKGIKLMWQNVDVPQIREKIGGGYIGVLDQKTQGKSLSKEAIRTLNITKDSTILVLGAWGEPGRYHRENGCAVEFENQGYKVTKMKALPEWSADPSLAVPAISGAVLSDPTIKLIVFSGNQLLGAAPIYMKALNMKPGKIKCIGFDTSPDVINAFEKKYVQLTSDQQPFLQGYLPILSLCATIKYQLAPMVVDTGAGFVNKDNFKNVKTLANLGIR